MNSPILQLLVLAGIAIFLVLRLRSVLGTREGFEKPPAPAPSDDRRKSARDFEVIEGGPDHDIIDHVAEDSEAAKALAAMKRIEPHFSVSEFLSGARGAYEMILMGFERGKIEDLRPFLADDVYQTFAEVVEQREQQGLTIESEFIGVRELTLADATFDEGSQLAEISVRYVGELTSVVKDAEGEVIETSDSRPSDDEIKAALGQFVGDIEQVPPKFSAVKIDGERAYKLARDGADVEIAARPLWVEELLLVDRPDADTAVLEMTCGKGGYVRAIARDLGRVLDCLGHVVTLRRIWSGPFDLETAVALGRVEELAQTPELDALLLPLETGLGDLPELHCGVESATRLRNGNPAEVTGGGDVEFGETAWVSHQGTPVAVGEYRGGKLQPSRVFVTG